jgi:hypothetical protein
VFLVRLIAEITSPSEGLSPVQIISRPNHPTNSVLSNMFFFERPTDA